MVIWDLSNKTLREELIGTYPGPDLPRVAPGSFPACRLPLGPIAAAAPPLAPSPPRLSPRRRPASIRSASVRRPVAAPPRFVLPRFVAAVPPIAGQALS